MSFYIVIVAIIAAAFWISQFMDLMSRPDDDFPGKYDKPIWAAAMIFGSVLGALVYWLVPQPPPLSNDSLRRAAAAAMNARNTRD
jgi:hypothetical protein